MGDQPIRFGDVQATNATLVKQLQDTAKGQMATGNRAAADEVNGEVQARGGDPTRVSADAIAATLAQHGASTEFLDNVLRRDHGDTSGMYDEAQFNKVMSDLGTADMLRGIYQQELGRMPDGQGLKDWTEVIDNLRARGLTGDALKTEITNRVRASEEYASKHPASTGATTAPETPGAPAGATGKVPSDSLQGTHGGQCVVFVEAQTGNYFPVGAAKEMLNDGKHPGYDVVHQPQPGDVFVATGGPYGHTGIVKSVNADGSLTVIDSNNNLDEVVHIHTIPATYAAGYLRRNPAEPASPYGRSG